MLKSLIGRNKKSIATLTSVVVGFFIAAIVLMAFGINPFNLFSSLISGAFQDKIALFKTLQIWTLYIILGLTVMIGFKIGLFNIGVSGQMMFGMLCSYAIVYQHQDWNPALLVFVSLVVTLVAAIVFATIAALLKTFFGVHEVVSTIMLNWIAVKIVNILYDKDYFPHGGFDNIQALPNKVNNNIESISPYFSWMFFISLISVVILFFVFRFTKIGQKIKITGTNPEAATYAGFNKKAMIIGTFAFSGLFAGLASFTYFFGMMGTSSSTLIINDLKSPINIGFLGIAIALVGMNAPIGVLFSSIFFALLNNPVGIDMAKSNYGIEKEVVEMFSSVIIYFVAITNIFIEFINYTTFKNWCKKYKHEMKDSDRKVLNKILLSLNYFLTFNIARTIYVKIKSFKAGKVVKNV